MKRISKLRALAVLSVSSVVFQGCFWGNVTDAQSGAAIDGATVVVENCRSCPPAIAQTPHAPNYTGTYAFDSENGDPLIRQDGVEAVRMEVSAPGYLTRQLFHRVTYRQTFQGQRHDQRDVALVEEPWDPRLMTDADGDGLRRIEELTLGTDPNNRDTDGDALPDGWEVNGHQWIDYPSLGANPLRKNIFVECDYMTSSPPVSGSIADVVAAFANAPVPNPDGSEGIDLHVFVDEAIPVDPELSRRELRQTKAARFSPDRLRGFHYCVFGEVGRLVDANGVVSNPSGFVAGADFLAGVARNNTQMELAAHFMHELGHALGLKHGGGDNFNNKPNYLSVMNYSFDDDGLIIGGAGGNLDYSRFRLSSVDERAFSETLGLRVMDGPASMLSGYSTCYGIRDTSVPSGACSDRLDDLKEITDLSSAQDWNRDGVVSPSILIDLNHDGDFTVLHGFNDWANLDYSSGGRIGAPR